MHRLNLQYSGALRAKAFTYLLIKKYFSFMYALYTSGLFNT